MKFRKSTRNTITLVCLGVAFCLVAGAVYLPAQTYAKIHDFTDGADGAIPNAGLTIQGTSLYGTAYGGGTHRAGAVYRLQKHGSGWTFGTLYSFDPAHGDGSNPFGGVVFGPGGLLFGTTGSSGASNAGTVFKLQPRPSIPPSPLTPWNETVLYSFPGGSGGSTPLFEDVVFDPAGNMYGTTAGGGGIVWQLVPPGTWGTENVLVSFTGANGKYSYGGLTFDTAGNLYGTTYQGGTSDAGVVFQLVPVMGGWSENVLYNFHGGNDGADLIAGLIFDPAGNLYGAATAGGMNGGGTVFELSPPGRWTTFTPLYSFSSTGGPICPSAYGPDPGPGPWASLAMDSAGNLYGTTCADGMYGYGNVFELVKASGWSYSDLYDFTGGTDGAYPISNVVFDASGNLYGTASAGGSQGFGVVWEITP